MPHGLELPTGRTLVMGILNVTPDSFSDGGMWADTAHALKRARTLVEEGADIIDVGGESTRPGSLRVTGDQEWSRIAEVVETLVGEGIVVSVDTVHAETAARATRAGVALVNDVSGGCADPAMAAVVASSGCAFVIQHWRGFPGSTQEDFDYGQDVVGTLCAETLGQVDVALRAGVDPARIVVDPGLGFSLHHDQSWEVLDSVETLTGLGYPVLVGASRKRFLALRGDGDRDLATIAITRRVACAGRAVRDVAAGEE